MPIVVMYLIGSAKALPAVADALYRKLNESI